MGAGFKGSPEPGFAPRHRTPGPSRSPLWAERAGGEGQDEPCPTCFRKPRVSEGQTEWTRVTRAEPGRHGQLCCGRRRSQRKDKPVVTTQEPPGVLSR